MSGLYFGYLADVRRMRQYFIHHQAISPDSTIEINLEQIAEYCRFTITETQSTLERMKKWGFLHTIEETRGYIDLARLRKEFMGSSLLFIAFYILIELFLLVHLLDGTIPFFDYFRLSLPFHPLTTSLLLIVELLLWHFLLRNKK